MIKSVTATNFLGESVTVNLNDPNPDHGLIVLGLEGIGPPTADINTTAMATSDGSIFNSARAEERTILVKFIFTNSPQIEDARHRTYRYFPVKKEVLLTIVTDNRTANIKGYVESNEPDIFSDQESNQISIRCPDPFFFSGKTNTTVFSGIEPKFEFIYENEHPSNRETCFGEIMLKRENTVHYDGDADVGVTIYIHALGEVKNISIFNVRTREVMRIDTDKITTLTGEGIHLGDDIIIETTRGAKSILLLRDGHYTNILNCLGRDTDWFHITKGDNIFAYTAELYPENLYFTIVNRILYEGI